MNFVLLFLRKTPKIISSITNDKGKKNRLTSFLRMSIIMGVLNFFQRLKGGGIGKRSAKSFNPQQDAA